MDFIHRLQKKKKLQDAPRGIITLEPTAVGDSSTESEASEIMSVTGRTPRAQQ